MLGGVVGGYAQVDLTANVDLHATITAVVSGVTAKLNAALNAAHTAYTVVEAHTQVVAGTNYDLLLHTENNLKVKAKVFVPLPHLNAEAEVTSATYVN